MAKTEHSLAAALAAARSGADAYLAPPSELPSQRVTAPMRPSAEAPAPTVPPPGSWPASGRTPLSRRKVAARLRARRGGRR